jgi:hypothetical protein
MSFIAQALGLAESIEHKGKTYKISPLTMEVLGEWEMFLKKRAWDELQKMRRLMSPEEYQKRADGLIVAMGTGAFEFMGRASSEAQENMLTPTGRHLLFLRLKLANPSENVTDQLVQEMLETSLEEVAVKLGMMDAPDPNSQAPRQAAGGV